MDFGKENWGLGREPRFPRVNFTRSDGRPFKHHYLLRSNVDNERACDPLKLKSSSGYHSGNDEPLMSKFSSGYHSGNESSDSKNYSTAPERGTSSRTNMRTGINERVNPMCDIYQNKHESQEESRFEGRMQIRSPRNPWGSARRGNMYSRPVDKEKLAALAKMVQARRSLIQLEKSNDVQNDRSPLIDRNRSVKRELSRTVSGKGNTACTNFGTQMITLRENPAQTSFQHKPAQGHGFEGHPAGMEVRFTKKLSSSTRKGDNFSRPVDMDRMARLFKKAQERPGERRAKNMRRSDVPNLRTPLIDCNASTRKGPNSSKSFLKHNAIPFSMSKDDLPLKESINDADDDPPFQECCRSLCFDDDQRSQDSEDLTTPLDMMDMTAVISRTSVLLRDDDLPKERILRSNTQNDNKNCENFVNTTDSHGVRALASSNRLPEESHRARDGNAALLNKMRPKLTLNKSVAVEEKSCTSGKKSARPRFLKRRSGIPLSKYTPKKNKELKFQSLHKNIKLPDDRGTQRKQMIPVKTRRSVAQKIPVKTRRSVALNLPDIVVHSPESSEVKQNEKVLPKMCDASTSTHITFSLGKSPNKDLVKEVENLITEQEEICRKAKIISEQTMERRKNMKSSRLLENFMTSVSPLKRLRMMVGDKSSFVNDSASERVIVDEDDFASETVLESVTDTTLYCEDQSLCDKDSDMDITLVEKSGSNESLMESSGLNTTCDLNSSHLKWKHLNLNSRVFQTPSSRPKKALKQQKQEISEEEEKFDNKIEDDLSPFTEMAGDIERPSLAPMTPHSHHQVSVLKMSLRKQLDQLYE